MARRHLTFRRSPSQSLTLLASVCRPKILIPGTAIYYRNDVAREVCFLESGLVEVRPSLPPLL